MLDTLEGIAGNTENAIEREILRRDNLRIITTDDLTFKCY